MREGYEDLTGRTFGKRTVQWPVGRRRKHVMWLCLCSCGDISSVSSDGLFSGNQNHCMSCARTIHGEARTLRYKMWGSAKHRAKRRGVLFNISYDDINIPPMCPLLEIPLIQRKGSGTSHGSPTLDRIVPHLGYVKGNIRVISAKANLMKNDATLEEAELLVRNWRAQNG